ncbi:ABC transporter permease [Jongsikchunia kroppenstedtii]|uniref:ABC transporter permease n=1 Tax=Jongsikchunia kroppenstedtii TaxID=1121721 RepID=UPI0003695AA1|nr:ABC transporter permease [Jongsikchunia kroppenstedtii]
MLRAVHSEWIKLTSTRSPYWCLGIVAVFSIGLAVLIGVVAGRPGTSDDGLDAFTIALGLTGFGSIVLMVMAVLAVTSEYRFGTIRTTFQAVPRRGRVLTAKTLVYGGVAFVVSAVLVTLSLVIGYALAGHNRPAVALGGSDAIRLYWGVPVYSFITMVIGIAVGALVRQTAGAIVIVLVWSLVFESIVQIIPKVGDKIYPFLPFANGSHFVGTAGNDRFHWNPYVSLAYFAGVAVVLLVVAVVVTDRRDA